MLSYGLRPITRDILHSASMMEGRSQSFGSKDELCSQRKGWRVRRHGGVCFRTEGYPKGKVGFEIRTEERGYRSKTLHPEGGNSLKAGMREITSVLERDGDFRAYQFVLNRNYLGDVLHPIFKKGISEDRREKLLNRLKIDGGKKLRSIENFSKEEILGESSCTAY